MLMQNVHNSFVAGSYGTLHLNLWSGSADWGSWPGGTSEPLIPMQSQGWEQQLIGAPSLKGSNISQRLGVPISCLVHYLCFRLPPCTSNTVQLGSDPQSHNSASCHAHVPFNWTSARALSLPSLSHCPTRVIELQPWSSFLHTGLSPTDSFSWPVSYLSLELVGAGGNCP